VVQLKALIQFSSLEAENPKQNLSQMNSEPGRGLLVIVTPKQSSLRFKRYKTCIKLIIVSLPKRHAMKAERGCEIAPHIPDHATTCK
jgi:hypothetical protein